MCGNLARHTQGGPAVYNGDPSVALEALEGKLKGEVASRIVARRTPRL